MSNGIGGASGGKSGSVTGGAKKVLGFAVAIFVLMAIAPNVDALMSAAESIGGTVAGLFNAIGAMATEITTAFQNASAG